MNPDLNPDFSLAAGVADDVAHTLEAALRFSSSRDMSAQDEDK
jgi:hypothetical protein